MAKQSMLVELYNKYPQHRVEDNGNMISVRDGVSGKLILQLVETCHGDFECNQKRSGAKECLDRSAISESARVFENKTDGTIGKVQGWEDRRMLSDDFIKRFGKIPSIMEEKKLAQDEAMAASKKKADERVKQLKKSQEVA